MVFVFPLRPPSRLALQPEKRLFATITMLHAVALYHLLQIGLARVLNWDSSRADTRDRAWRVK